MDLLQHFFGTDEALAARLRTLHRRMFDTLPSVDRVACALYDAQEDLLKTFVHSTRVGTPISRYEYKLADSRSLSEIAATGRPRALNDLHLALRAENTHTTWVLEQGYRSSFTVPIHDSGALLGMVFYDSVERDAFPPVVQRDLLLYTSLINMAIAHEIAAVRAITTSTKVARDLSDLRDFETGAHLDRMSRYARIIARAIAPKYDLTDEFIEHVFLFAPLHDVGKIGIPDAILLKHGALTPEEREQMRSHVLKGMEVVQRMLGDLGLQHFPDSSVLGNIVRAHHEFLDGSGYPLGLQGTAVPLEARIVTAADIFDALTSPRPYKLAWTREEALAEMGRMVEAGKLDRDCVEALRHCDAEVSAIFGRYQDVAAA